MYSCLTEEIVVHKHVNQVVTVQNNKIGAERLGFNPSSVCQFLFRIGEEAKWLSIAESCEHRVWSK
jgi:hypothetical protein